MSVGPKPNHRQRPYLQPLIVVGVLLLLVCSIPAFFFLFLTVIGINSDGSIELATEWKEEMSSWESPEDATGDSTLSIYRLTNGEWAIVKSKNSHGGFWTGGGTIVVKDSRGQLNAFYGGHVCGDGNPFFESEQDNLDAFYKAFAQSDFLEFEF